MYYTFDFKYNRTKSSSFDFHKNKKIRSFSKKNYNKNTASISIVKRVNKNGANLLKRILKRITIIIDGQQQVYWGKNSILTLKTSSLIPDRLHLSKEMSCLEPYSLLNKSN